MPDLRRQELRVPGLAIPGMKVEIEAVVGLPA
jgi:hypothetical protein